MAPLLDPAQLDDSCEDVFSLYPLKMELDAAIWANSNLIDQTQRKAIVRFEDGIELINPFPEYYTDEDIQIKWFGSEELHEIKQRAKDDSTELRRTTKGHETCLCVAHRKTSLMLKSDFKSLVKLSPSTPDQDLTEWCSSDDGRRGLERFASRDYAALRRKDICETRTVVIEEYARQQSFYVKDPESIAELARFASRRARTFARFFAAADAIAAKCLPAGSSSTEPATRRLPARCQSEMQSCSRRAPPRKRSKQYHREEFFPMSTS